MYKTNYIASLFLGSALLLLYPAIARSLDLQDILEGINQGMQQSNEQQAIEQCSQPSRRSDFWCNLFWQMRGGRPTGSPNSNPASGTSLPTLIQLYQSVSQQRQAAEARFRACTSTNSSPLSCSSTVVESLAARESTYRDMIGQALINATERTYNDPRLCAQTINSYRQAMNARLPFAANMSNIVAFCRSRGMSF
jgi:hypothetical protein